jgi:hypothetical protein
MEATAMPANFVHIPKRLADLSLRFPAVQETQRHRFFPARPTAHLSDLITKWNTDNVLRVDDLDMSGDEDLPGLVELVLDANDSFTCKILAARAMAKEVTSKNADPSIDYEVERALATKQRLDTLLEYRAIKKTLRDSTIMSGSFETCSAGQQFDGTGSGVDPVAKLTAIALTIKTQTGGFMPNVCTMSSFTLAAIAASESFKDRSKFTTLVVGDKASADGRARILESLIGLAPGTIETTDAVYNNGKAGVAGAKKQFIGSAVIMAYVEPPAIRTQGFGAAFQWSGFSADPIAIIKVPQFNHGVWPGEEMRAISVVDFKPYNVVAGYTLDQAVDPTKTGNGFLD